MKPLDTDRSFYCFYLLSRTFDALEGKIIAWQTPGLKSQHRALTMSFNSIQYLSYISELLDMTLQSLPLKESFKPPSNTSHSWRELFRGSYDQVPWHFRTPAAAGMQQAGTEAKECFLAGSLTPIARKCPAAHQIASSGHQSLQVSAFKSLSKATASPVSHNDNFIIKHLFFNRKRKVFSYCPLTVPEKAPYLSQGQSSYCLSQTRDHPYTQVQRSRASFQ